MAGAAEDEGESCDASAAFRSRRQQHQQQQQQQAGAAATRTTTSAIVSDRNLQQHNTNHTLFTHTLAPSRAYSFLENNPPLPLPKQLKARRPALYLPISCYCVSAIFYRLLIWSHSLALAKSKASVHRMIVARTAGEKTSAKTAGAAAFARTADKEANAKTAGAAAFARTEG